MNKINTHLFFEYIEKNKCQKFSDDDIKKYIKKYDCKTANSLDIITKNGLIKSGLIEMSNEEFMSLDMNLFKEIKDSIIDKSKDNFCKNPLLLKGIYNVFIINPFGSQEFPDFLIIFTNYMIAIENKSSTEKGASPMWNSNLPKRNSIYILMNFKRNDLTFFCGKDVIDKEVRNILLDCDKDMEDISRQCREKLRKIPEKNGDGFDFYPRGAFNQNKQTYEDAQTNFFKHTERLKREKESLDVFFKLSQ